MFVDVGFGEHLDTTVESARALRARHPRLRVLGLERDTDRLANAAERAREEGIELGQARGFGWEGPRADVARAMNVLRQHLPEDVAAAHASWSRHLSPGGLLIEGTCDRRGERLCAHLIRESYHGLTREGLLFHFGLESSFAPIMLRDYLPQDLRRKVKAGTRLGSFFEDWTAAWERTREGATTPWEAFARSARALRDVRADVDGEDALLEEGIVVWRPEGGVAPEPSRPGPSRAERP